MIGCLQRHLTTKLAASRLLTSKTFIQVNNRSSRRSRSSRSRRIRKVAVDPGRSPSPHLSELQFLLFFLFWDRGRVLLESCSPPLTPPLPKHLVGGGGYIFSLSEKSVNNKKYCQKIDQVVGLMSHGLSLLDERVDPIIWTS